VDSQTDPNAFDFTFVPTLNPIFGTDFLGWGFDADYRDPFFALKPQLFQFSYNNPPAQKEKSYRYPIDVQSYAVPDQVFVRTVAKTTTETYSFLSSNQQIFTLDLKLGLTMSTAQLQGELALDVNFVQEGTSNTSIIMNFAETSLYQLYLGQRILRDEITTAMSAFRSTYKLDPDSYEFFLSRYGTHFVDSIVIGGSIMQETIINFNSETEKLQLTASLKGKFESATGGGRNSMSSPVSGNGTTSGGGTTVSGELDVFVQSIELIVNTQTTSNSEIYGGDPEFTDFLLTAGAPAATQELFESWKSTLMTNPVGIRYRLVEIWTLFDDPSQQIEMCTAMGTVLGFLPGEAPNFCSISNRLLGGTIRQGLGGTGGL